MEEYGIGEFVGPKGITQKQFFLLFGAKKASFYLSILRTST